MEPFIVIMVPGLLGGVLVALLIVRFSTRSQRVSNDGGLAPPSTNMINMASIRVSGIGGLGMVAMAVTVAIFVPRIRLTMAIALLLGGALAGGLIALRRRNGPLPSSSHPGAHSMLSIDTASDEVGSGESAPADDLRELSELPAQP
jgi:hypothetical protein